MFISKRMITIAFTALAGFATTILSCVATDKAKKIVEDESLTKKDKIVGVAKCYAAPAVTLAVTVAAGKEIIDGYESDLDTYSTELNQANKVLIEYRSLMVDQIGKNKDLDAFDRALFESIDPIPADVFKKLKPNEMLFYDHSIKKYFVMPYAKMMSIDKYFLNKINDCKRVEGNEYYRKVGLPTDPFTSNMGWYLSEKETWDDFQYYSIYDIQENGESLGKLAIIHPYPPIKKSKEVFDGEYKDITEANKCVG